jgi:hypothetical protein
LSEPGIFGQKAVTGVHGVGMGALGRLKQTIDP